MSTPDESLGMRSELVLSSSEPRVLSDPGLLERSEMLVAFSLRNGGVSADPYDSLNLAAHVGDDPLKVDENRSRLLESLGIPALRDRLVTSEQVHSDQVHVLTAEDAGRGAFASGGQPPIPSTDGIVITVPEVPVLMLYADCVPVVLVSEGPRRGMAVVHAGWKGALAGLPGKVAEVLIERTGAVPETLVAYVGPYIHDCCYEVGEELTSQFNERFGTIAPVALHLDLGSAVRASLAESGIPADRVVDAGRCTKESSREYFSYRARARTGRHGALVLLKTKGA